MNEVVTENDIKIENLIYEIRGKHVMLDCDLAKLYQCKNGAKVINQAVKRHINRFPEDFCFQINEIEYKTILRSQSVTLELKQGKYSKYLPYVFTEEGVSMLSSILRTPIAEDMSVKIMRTFVSMRKYISINLIEQKYINNQVMKNTEDIKLLQESFSKLEEKKKINEIYFNGQIYDAYSKIVDIMKESKQELIIIDRYADKTVLDMISKVEVIVKLITKKNGLLSKLDIEKYQKQYDNLKIKYDDTFHDRYIIVDKEIFYHLGASVNHVGSRTFSINILEDDCMKKFLLAKLIYSEF